MLKNFEVIEIKKVCTPKSAPLNLIIEPKRVRFVKSIVETLGYPPHVHLLANPKGKQFAIQVCKGNERNVFKFSKPKEEQTKAILIQNEVMINIIHNMKPEWTEEINYIVTGDYDQKEKAIIFDLNHAVPYSRKALMNDTRTLKA